MKPLTINESGVFSLPADGVCQLWPRGEWPIALDMLPNGLNAFGTADRVAVQVLDDAALEAMTANPPTGKAALIDYEHFSHDPEKSSEAAGWIESLIAAEDGLNFTARWSDGGLAALLGGRFRYISPVAPPAECEVLSHNPLRIRPLRIRTAGLTNDPNLRGKPLSNRRTEDDPAATQTQKGNTPMLKTETIAAILACCGLPPEASDEQVLAAIPDCENKMKCFDGLKNRHDALLAAQVDSDLEQYSAVITADAKPKWKTALLANRESALALLSGITVPTETTQATALTNRATAKNPADASAEADLKKATARAGVIRNRATELRAANPRMSLATAYAAAEEEINAKAN